MIRCSGYEMITKIKFKVSLKHLHIRLWLINIVPFFNVSMVLFTGPYYYTQVMNWTADMSIIYDIKYDPNDPDNRLVCYSDPFWIEYTPTKGAPSQINIYMGVLDEKMRNKIPGRRRGDKGEKWAQESTCWSSHPPWNKSEHGYKGRNKIYNRINWCRQNTRNVWTCTFTFQTPFEY